MHITETLLVNYALNAIWQAPLVLLCALAASSIARRVSLEREHQVWVIALLLQTLLPALSLLPASVPDWITRLSSGLLGGHAHSRGTVTVAMDIMRPLHARLHNSNWVAVLVWLYGVLLLLAAIRLMRRSAATQVMFRNARILPGPRTLPFMLPNHDQTLRVRIGVSSDLASPAAIGCLRGTILLPLRWRRSISADDIRAALAHEAAHVVRHDFAKNLCYEVLASPLLFHPAVWMTQQKLAETREMVCDDLAARTGESPRTYAHSLLRLATAAMNQRPNSTLHYGIGIFDAGILDRRIMQLTKPRPRPRHVVLHALILVALLVVATTSAMAFAVRIDSPAPFSNVQNDKPVTVRSGEMKIIRQVMPVYPPDARAKKINGTVVLHAIIDKDGRVQSLTVVSGPKVFYASAIDAVKQWTWEPLLVQGRPEEADTHISVNFAIF